MVGAENELANFFFGVSVSDGRGGYSTTYSPIAFNPVWVEITEVGIPLKGEGLESAMKWYDHKKIRFRQNNLWTPEKNMILEIRGKKFSLLSLRDIGTKDEYYECIIHKIDH
jgi:hypothetical protein